MCRLHIVLIVVCSGIVLSDAEFDNNCIMNPLKPASLPHNYMDCSNDDHNNKGEFTCCDSQGTKVCCSLERRWGGVRYIAIGVGCTAILLGTMLFIVLWCNVVDKPCVTPIPYCCCGKRRKKRMNKTKILELEEVVSVATEKIHAIQVDDAYFTLDKLCGGSYKNLDFQVPTETTHQISVDGSRCSLDSPFCQCLKSQLVRSLSHLSHQAFLSAATSTPTSETHGSLDTSQPLCGITALTSDSIDLYDPCINQ